jgi:diguanylate cyclase (GGDEF)-like protein
VDGTTTAQRDPASKIPQLLVLIGLAAWGALLFSWTSGVAPDRLESGNGAALTVALLLMVGVFPIAATVLLWHARRSGGNGVVREPATGLYQMRFVDEVLEGLMADDDRSGTSRLVLVRIAIDFLEDLAQRHGPMAMETIRRRVGRHIVSQVRRGDLPAVGDGAGFAVYLRCTEAEEAEVFCRRLATLLRSDQLEVQGSVIKVSTSMGVALRRIGEPKDALEARARQNLARAVAAGGDRSAI